MIKKFARLGFILLAAGCMINQDYGATLQPWIGQSEASLEQSWGIPHNVFYVTPNEKVVTYVEFSTHAKGGISDPYSDEFYYAADSTPDFDYPSAPMPSDYYCKTSFTISNGIVTNYSFNGDDCVTERW